MCFTILLEGVSQAWPADVRRAASASVAMLSEDGHRQQKKEKLEERLCKSVVASFSESISMRRATYERLAEETLVVPPPDKRIPFERIDLPRHDLSKNTKTNSMHFDVNVRDLGSSLIEVDKELDEIFSEDSDLF